MFFEAATEENLGKPSFEDKSQTPGSSKTQHLQRNSYFIPSHTPPSSKSANHTDVEMFSEAATAENLGKPSFDDKSQTPGSLKPQYLERNSDFIPSHTPPYSKSANHTDVPVFVHRLSSQGPAKGK
jgi:hypothetical protein